MAQDQTILYNMAAQAIGLRGKFVTTSDKHRAVEVFNLWYEHVRNEVFAAAWWEGVSKTSRLVLAVERTNADWAATDPVPGAAYAYTLPDDFIYPRQLSTFGHFSLSIVGSARVLSTHEEDAILTYTANQTNMALWEPDLFLSVVFALAAFTANALTGDKNLVNGLEVKANDLIGRARTRVANDFNQPVESVASWHRARGYVGPVSLTTRFVYPHGPMVHVGESANVK